MIAIYARQSVDKKDSISIESQIDNCKDKLLPNEEYHTYEDKGFSGKNTDRPQFKLMMEDIKNGSVKKVVVYKLDRISRSIVDFANMMDIFEQRKVNLISCNEQIDTTTPFGIAMLNIIMTFAQLERQTIQQRIKDNYYSRGKQGYYLGGRAPFGYNKIDAILNGKKTYSFAPDTKKAEQVYQLFDEYGNTDTSLGKMIKKLNNGNVRINIEGAWSSVTLGRLLRNPVYVKANADVYLYLKNKGANMNNEVTDYIGVNGCYVYAERKSITTSKFTNLSQSYVTLALHEGLIPPDLWLRCQYRLDNNKQIKNSGKGTHSWLSGIMKCGYCGMAVTVVNNSRGHNYINCGGRKLKICYDRKRVLKLTDIESITQGQLLQRMQQVKTQGISSLSEDSAELNLLKIQLVQIEEKINNYITQIEKANDVVMSYINKNVSELDKDKKGIISAIMRISDGRNKPKYNDLELDRCFMEWDNFILEEKKAVAKTFINRVDITDETIYVDFY